MISESVASKWMKEGESVRGKEVINTEMSLREINTPLNKSQF